MSDPNSMLFHARTTISLSFPMRMLAALAAGVCFSVSVVAALSGWSDLSASYAIRTLSTWQSTGRMGDQVHWTTAYRRIGFALSAAPNDAEYWLTMGHLMYWQSLRLSSDRDYAETYASQAWQAYLRAASHRPSWGYAWVNAATVGFAFSRSGTRAERALVLAMHFAPWEPVVQRRAIWLGIRYWRRLSPATREDVRGTVRRALMFEKQVSWVLRSAVSLNWQAQLRAVLTDPRHVDRLNRLPGGNP